jgi:hypothetical protein
MCNLVSWVELKINEKTKEYFLTTKDLKTKEGVEFKKYLGKKCADDIVGHGAIEHYFFEVKGKGVHKECEDFTSPKNFPKSVSQAIKKGLFNYAYTDNLLTMLTPKARADYDKIYNSARAEFNRIVDPARAEFNRIVDPALADYDKIYNSALADYDKIVNSALADYNVIKRVEFWKLFSDKKNRINAWK